MSTNTKTEPLSLELFNRAAVDLDQKGEIELERYKKYLFNREWWMQHLNFQLTDLNMEFAIHLVRYGHNISNNLFVDILTEKCQLLHKHIKSSQRMSDVGSKHRRYNGYHQTIR